MDTSFGILINLVETDIVLAVAGVRELGHGCYSYWRICRVSCEVNIMLDEQLLVKWQTGCECW
jgi:hypothetical protein